MTKTDVANMALTFLGSDLVSDIVDPTAAGKRLRLVYDRAAFTVLTFHEWKDAVFFSSIMAESADPNNRETEYQYIFDIPADTLKVLEVYLDPRMDRLVEGRWIYTNYFEPADGLLVRCLSDIREEVGGVLEYGDHIGEVIARRMAHLLAPVFAPKMQPGEALAFYREALDEAVAFEADERTHRFDGSPRWEEVV